MNINTTIGSLALATLGLAVVASTFVSFDRDDAAVDPANVPAAPVQPKLVHAERFEVDNAFHHVWRADRPPVRSGWLMVLAVEEDDRHVLRPTQLKQPVLYVGAQTADRVNLGFDSGHVVAIVPDRTDPTRDPAWFGPKALPEELTARQIARELQVATAAGAVPLAGVGDPRIQEGSRRFDTDYELRLAAIDLVEQYSPQERDLISGWRVPRVR